MNPFFAYDFWASQLLALLLRYANCMFLSHIKLKVSPHVNITITCTRTYVQYTQCRPKYHILIAMLSQCTVFSSSTLEIAYIGYAIRTIHTHLKNGRIDCQDMCMGPSSSSSPFFREESRKESHFWDILLLLFNFSLFSDMRTKCTVLYVQNSRTM